MSPPITNTRSLVPPPTPRKCLHERNVDSPTRRPRLIAAMRRLRFSREEEHASQGATISLPDIPPPYFTEAPFELDRPEISIPRAQSPPLQVD